MSFLAPFSFVAQAAEPAVSRAASPLRAEQFETGT